MPTFKPCKRCGEAFPANRHQVRCFPCMVVFKADPEEKRKQSASRAVQHAVRTGKLVRTGCEECGKSPVQGHHNDYSEPLKVRWLCAMHHRWVHMPGMVMAGLDRRAAEITAALAAS